MKETQHQYCRMQFAIKRINKKSLKKYFMLLYAHAI